MAGDGRLSRAAAAANPSDIPKTVSNLFGIGQLFAHRWHLRPSLAVAWCVPHRCVSRGRQIRLLRDFQ
jgi:hypothetical protein